MFLLQFVSQLHLQRKTAWSNQSLLGCRISCLIDSKEWHEGIVTHFHRSGKHNVEFRAIGEKRWLNMAKMAFHILEQPAPDSSPTSNEYKENDDGELPPGYLSLDVSNQNVNLFSCIFYTAVCGDVCRYTARLPCL
jgi:hypothetical protein